MKLLLDEGLPRSAAVILNAAGTDTVHVGAIGYAAADDSDILQKARESGRIVVTLDADFHSFPGAEAPTSGGGGAPFLLFNT